MPTSQDERKAYVVAMGEQLGSVFCELSQELVRLNMLWHQYVAVFGSDPKQLEIANKSAPAFFYFVQKCMWDSIIMCLARMVDQPVTMKKYPNLTLRRLELLVPTEHKAETNRLTIEVVRRCSFATDWRMGYLAHKDLELAMEESARPLETASRNKVRDAIEGMEELLNWLGVTYMDTTTWYEGIDPLGGAETLLDVLSEGLASRERRETEEMKAFGLDRCGKPLSKAE